MLGITTDDSAVPLLPSQNKLWMLYYG